MPPRPICDTVRSPYLPGDRAARPGFGSAFMVVRHGWCAPEANDHNRSFYQRLGFVGVEPVRDGLLHGEALPMLLAIDAIMSARES